MKNHRSGIGVDRSHRRINNHGALEPKVGAFSLSLAGEQTLYYENVLEI